MNYNDFFNKAKEKNISNIQVTEKTEISSNVQFINGKLESYDDSNLIHYHTKAEINKKTVKVDSDYLSEDILDLIILKIENTDSNYEDEYLTNMETIKKEKNIEINISNELEILKELDKLRINNPEISKLNTYFTEEYTNTRIINSNGIDISTNSHLCQFMVEVIGEKDGDFVSYDRSIIKANKKEIDFEKITKDTISKMLILKNKEKIKTNKYDIVLDSVAASRIISNLGKMLAASAIRNKVSCLENKLDQKVFNDNLTIIEDPTNKNYPGYHLFDDEGTLTYKKDIIKNGVIKTNLYNIKEAKIKNIKSTANGYNGIGTQNMYVIPGGKSQEELISEVKEGLLIVDFMGAMNSAINISTGNISLQVFGFIIKDGKVISGMQPCVMTTTIFELLSNIKEIGNDLEFVTTNTASPTLLIENISVAS